MGLLINGERIDDAVLDSEFSGIKAYFESLGNVSCCERNDEFRGYARQNIIARVLLTQHALAAIPEPTEDDVEFAYQKLTSEHGGESRFLHTIGATTDNLDQIKHDLATNLRVERLIDRELAND